MIHIYSAITLGRGGIVLMLALGMVLTDIYGCSLVMA
jgi:hypothetical protein